MSDCSGCSVRLSAGERRLDRETNIMSLCRVNPHAEWVIKD